MNPVNNAIQNGQLAGTAPQAKFIDVEPIQFESTIEAQMTTSVELGKLVYRLFKAAIPDTDGVVVGFNPTNGQIEGKLYFALTDGTGAGGIQTLVGSRQANVPVAQRMTSMALRSRNKTIELTAEAKELIEPFLNKPNSGSKINWEATAIEMIDQQQLTQRPIIRVSGLNLVKVLRAIYGNKSPEGASYDYDISAVRPLNQLGNDPESVNYLIRIQRLDTAEMQKLAAKAGMVATTGSVFMVRG